MTPSAWDSLCKVSRKGMGGHSLAGLFVADTSQADTLGYQIPSWLAMTLHWSAAHHVCESAKLEFLDAKQAARCKDCNRHQCLEHLDEGNREVHVD